MRFVVMAVIALAASGCVWNVDRPNPYEYERWSRLGDDQIAVRKAMLECGYPSPNGVRDRMITTETTPDEIAMMGRCMTNSGYLYDGKVFDVCRAGYSDVSACQSGASIPKRDVARRLNGKFCQVFPLADV